jgi:hypothetical protein
MWRNLKQLAKEFWLPALMGAAWTSFVVGTRGKIVDYVANFSGSFFFSSWLTGQYNRVDRAHQTRDSFKDLLNRLNKMGITIETIRRWMAESEKPRNSPPSVATPKSIEKIEAVASKDEKLTDTKKNGNDVVGNVIDFAAYRARWRNTEVISILERSELDDSAPSFAA